MSHHSESYPKLHHLMEHKAAFSGLTHNTEDIATKEEIATLRKKVKQDMDCDLPNEYLDFLEILNGVTFPFSRYMILGVREHPDKDDPGLEVPGFLEENLDRWLGNEEFRDFVIFALNRGERASYAYCLSKKEYQLIDEDYLDEEPSAIFSSFHTMINAVLDKIQEDFEDYTSSVDRIYFFEKSKSHG